MTGVRDAESPDDLIKDALLALQEAALAVGVARYSLRAAGVEGKPLAMAECAADALAESFNTVLDTFRIQ